MPALKRGPQPSTGVTEMRQRGREKQCRETAVCTEVGRIIDVSWMKGVGKDITRGVNSKRRGTEIRQHEVFSDLKGSYDSLPRLCILRG